MTDRSLTRRRLVLRGAVAALGFAGTAILSACGGAATATASASSGGGATPTGATAATGSVAPAPTAATASASNAPATPAAAVSGSTTTVSPAASTAAVAQNGKVTLTYVSPDTPGRFDVEDAIFADFGKEQPGIAVEIVAGSSSWGAVETKLKASIAAGQAFDLFQNGWGYWADIQAGMVEFTSYLARDKMDPTKTFIPLAIDYFTQGGKLWAMPVVGVSVDALAYNQDLFDAAGLAYPPTNPDDTSWSMDAFLDHAQKLTKADRLQFGFGGSLGGDDTGGQERPTYFGQWPWDDKAQKAMLDQPKAVAGLQFFKDLRDKYKVQPDADQKKAIGAKGDIFTSGKIGMQAIYGYVPKQAFRWAIAPLPFSNSTNISGRQYAQPLQAMKTPRTEQAWALLKWLSVPANAARFPLSAHYAVSPVIGASDLAVATYKAQIGVDPAAFQQMTQRSDPQIQERYLGWNEVSTWMGKNFPLFDQGKLSAADYGKAATDYINTNLVK